MAKHDVPALKRAIPLVGLISQYVELKTNGPEMIGLCPFHSEHTPSFTVEEDKGVSGLYYCHGCGEGGDQVAFLQKLLGLDPGQAIAKLADIVNGGDAAPDARTVPRETLPERKPRRSSPWQPAETLPHRDEAPPTSVRLQRGGEWREFPVVKAWAYRDAAGELRAYDCRVEPEPGKKDIIPFIWKVNTETGETAWKQGSLPKPRTLYGAELLAARPGEQVLVVEGCKTADAARRLLSAFPVIVVSWMGGGKAVRFADWSALAGRKVVIWPDCDSQRDELTGDFKPYIEQAGMAAALAIIEQLEPHGAQGRIVAVPAPGLWEDGYDLADAEAQGRDEAWVTGYLRDNLSSAEDIRNARAPQPAGQREPSERPHDDGQPSQMPDIIPAEAYQEDSTRMGGPPVAQGEAGEPFRILGWDRLTAYYLPDNSEQIIDLTAAAHTKNNLIALAPLAYWEATFPSSKKGAHDGIDWSMAINALIQRSQTVGIYDPEVVRGRGAWWDGGKWAVHLGNRVIIDGNSYNLRDAPTRYIYEKSATMHIRFEDPLPPADSVKLVKICESFRWVRPISGKLLAGWIFLAPVCGALEWRPHIWLTGGAGSGKSTVITDLIGRSLRGICLQVEGDTSEAGIRQTLVHDARPVVFDEFESERKKSELRVEDVLAMATRASSESDAQLLKGSGDGKAQGYRTRAMFCFSSIGVNLKQFAAASRVTVLDLYSEPESEAGLARFNQMMEDLFTTLTPDYIERLQARAVTMIPVIRENAQTFSEAAALCLKSRRMGDQIGTLLAGVYALHGGKLISRADAVAWIQKQNWDDVSEVAEGKDEVNCVAHVLAYQLRLDTGDGAIHRSLGEMIQIAARFGEGARDASMVPDTAAATLRRHGIKVDGDGASASVSFASNHRELKRILSGTAWESAYTRTLLRIPGAAKHLPAKFGAVSCRGVKVPIGAIL